MTRQKHHNGRAWQRKAAHLMAARKQRERDKDRGRKREKKREGSEDRYTF
jgi:hypothetical protein